MRYQTIDYTDSLRHTFTFRVVDPKWLNLNPNRRGIQYQYPESQRWELTVDPTVRNTGIRYIPHTFVKDNTVLFDEWREYCRSVNPDTDYSTLQMFSCVPRVWSDNLAGITQLAREYYNTYGDKDIKIIDNHTPFSHTGNHDNLNGEIVWRPIYCGLPNTFTIIDILENTVFDYKDTTQLGKALERACQTARKFYIQDIDAWANAVNKQFINKVGETA